MRRKLIKQDVFDKITNESVTAAERELVEAAPVLAKALGRNQISLHSFNESTVVFETLDDTFVHAGFGIKNEAVNFTNIEELVIDESSRKDKQQATLSEMIDAVLQDDHASAKDLFTNYLDMVRWSEFKDTKVPRNGAKNEHRDESKILKTAKALGLQKEYVTARNVLEYVDFMKFGPAV